MQSLIRPSPGFTPAHCVLTSLTQVLATPLSSAANTVEHGSKKMAVTRKRGLVIATKRQRLVMCTSCLRRPRADDIESVAVTDKAILLHGTGKRETDRTWSAV